MASPSRVRDVIALEGFLKLPNIDEQLYLEYTDGQIEAKALPQTGHSTISLLLSIRLRQFIVAARLGRVFPEPRCTFAGRSIVPDIAFLRQEHIELDDRGAFANVIRRPPDLHIEIVSPDQPLKKTRAKLAHAVGHGCPLGWLFHLDQHWIEVCRPDRPPERLPDDGALEGEPILPGFRLPVVEVFGWLSGSL
jgi:Uma2 family endonuclease